MSFAELVVSIRAAEKLNPEVRFARIFSTAGDLPVSIHLAYSHPLVIAADFNGYETTSGETHRI